MSSDDPFVRLVSEMRAAQREYFRTRSASTLNVSKWLERRVDQAIRDMHEDRFLFAEMRSLPSTPEPEPEERPHR